MFHIEKGLFFEKMEDGRVHIVVKESAQADSPILREFHLKVNGWASVMATVSKDGESWNKWSEALDFHGFLRK